MRMVHIVMLTWLVGGLPASAAEIPFPATLDAAAVLQSQIADIHREALMLGNGDLHGLLWERSGTLCLRVAKNDLWDARVDTSQDVPLMKVDVANQTSSGGGYPPSWKKPYPQPRCAAVVRIGAAGSESGVWRCIRSGGKVNEWLRRDDVGVMAIEGTAGASAGYRWTLDPQQPGPFTALKFHISGTPGARYYVNVLASEGKHPVASGWRDTPATEQEVAFPIAAGSPVSAIELYVMTADGARVENRIGGIVLEGGPQRLAIAPGMRDGGVKSARLDLRRAVAEVGGTDSHRTTVRVLAGRNVFLIESDKEVSLEEIKSPILPAAELGETDGVKWLSMNMPGDPDYPGMEYALAVAAGRGHRAVAMVTSFETQGNVRDAAIRLARETADAELSALIAGHERQWADYWSASGVELDDPDFQLWWYRMVYYLRCFARPGAMPVGLFAGLASDRTPWHGDYHHNYNGGIPGYRARIRPIVSRITIHWPSFYNVVTGKTLALPNLIALQHIPLSPAGVIAKRPAPIALPNSCAAEWRMAPDAVFSPYASVRYFTPHMVHSQYNLL